MQSQRRWMILIPILLLVPSLYAKPSSDWKDVEDLKWDLPVRIELWNGEEYTGRFDAADATTLRLKVHVRGDNGQTGAVQTFPRAQVHIVEKLSGRDPDLQTYRRGGAIAGGVAGAAVLGTAIKHSAWPAGVLFGGVIGTGAGMIAGDTVALVAHARSGHQKIVYQSHQQPGNAPSSPPGDN